MNSFTEFFAGEFQSLLEANKVLPDEAYETPPAEPYPVSWDRSAAWIVYNLMKGTTMAGRPRKAAVNDSAAKIIEALNFTKIGVKNDADQYGRMAYLANGWMFTNNGIIAAGMHLGGNDLTGYVDHAQLAGALANVGKELTISSSEMGIEIKSGDFEAMVLGYDTETMRAAPPDPIPQGGAPYPLSDGDGFRKALEVAGRVVKDTAEHVRDAAIYNLGNALLATNGIQIVEAWHGNNVPPGVIFPKAFANAINKTDKKIVGFTFDQQGYKSFTIWFEDQSFIRTNLYAYADYPQAVVQKYGDMFANFDRVIDTPKGFFEAVAMVTPFGDDGKVAITGGAVCTDWREGEGWYTHKAVKGLPEGVWCTGQLVSSFSDATKVYLGDPAVPGSILLFAGEKGWRAAVAGVQRPMPVASASGAAPVAATMPDPATAPAWGQPAAPVTPPLPASPPAAAAPAAGVVLPFTPRSRQTTMQGAPGWDTTPYTLQPGETPEQFCVEGEAPPQWVMAAPANPPVASGPSTGAPAFAAPVTAEAFPPVPATATAPAQTPQGNVISPSEIPGGFTPFQPAGQAGAGFTANPVPQQSAPATPAPDGGSAPWQTNAGQSPSSPAPNWGEQSQGGTPDFSAFAAFNDNA